MMNNKIIICDIDGVLADNTHRAHLAKPETWAWFCDLSFRDVAIQQTKLLINIMSFSGGYQIVLITGRSEGALDGQYKKELQLWLKQNDITYHKLYMRDWNDVRSDVAIKQELLHRMLDEYDAKYNDVLFAIEDSLACAKMYRSYGIMTFHNRTGEPKIKYIKGGDNV